MTKPDYVIEGGGTIYLCIPQSDHALAWLRDHVSEDSQWLGRACAVEARYVITLAQQLTEDGFLVELRP